MAIPFHITPVLAGERHRLRKPQPGPVTLAIRAMRLISAVHHWWLIRAARRDMRSAAFFVGHAEDRLKAAGLSVPPPMEVVPLLRRQG